MQGVSFRDGDSITITEVKATSPDLKAGDKVIVKGHYTLSSKPKASLCLFMTATKGLGIGPVHPEQQLNITKGEGEFELSETLEGDGYLHVTFYSVPDGKGFGGMYFGTAKQMKEIEHWDVQSWYTANTYEMILNGTKILFNHGGNKPLKKLENKDRFKPSRLQFDPVRTWVGGLT